MIVGGIINACRGLVSSDSTGHSQMVVGVITKRLYGVLSNVVGGIIKCCRGGYQML